MPASKERLLKQFVEQKKFGYWGTKAHALRSLPPPTLLQKKRQCLQNNSPSWDLCRAGIVVDPPLGMTFTSQLRALILPALRVTLNEVPCFRGWPGLLSAHPLNLMCAGEGGPQPLKSGIQPKLNEEIDALWEEMQDSDSVNPDSLTRLNGWHLLPRPAIGRSFGENSSEKRGLDPMLWQGLSLPPILSFYLNGILTPTHIY